jgi:hypothetical protein
MSNQRGLITLYVRRLKSQGLGMILQAAIRPKRTVHHIKRILKGEVAQLSNFYPPSVSRDAELAFCSEILNSPVEEVEPFFHELESNSGLLDALRGTHASHRSGGLEFGRFKALYAIVRMKQPDVVVETGVHDGLSSALLLEALRLNEKGKLISIDLPSTDLPTGITGPGWLILEYLKGPWHLLLGDSRKILPQIAAQELVDIFHHDSDHSSRHQEFEVSTVRPAMMPSGIILVDDCDFDLLQRFADTWQTPTHQFAHVGGINLSQATADAQEQAA